MQELTANTSNQHKPYKYSDRRVALHLCYGEIGIPAVAAAARYSNVKDPGYPPVAIKSEYRSAAII